MLDRKQCCRVPPLTAAIDFLVEMKVANPESAKRFAGLDSEMIGLHTSLEELWIDYDAEEQEEKEQEQEDMERAKGYEVLADAGADIVKIIKEDARAEVEEENEQNEQLWEEINADYKLPAGWPLDYPR
ncbi:MAG: hypothetical protein ABSB63_14930 [Spirochaetia bacterium]